jgi:hypothetical protein
MEEKETRRLVHQRIDRENELLAHRTAQVVASQAFMFSAYSILLVGATRCSESGHSRTMDALVRMLPWTAIVSLALLYITIAGGIRALVILHRLVSEADEPLEFGDILSRVSGLAAPVLVPAVFLATWLVVVLIHRQG